MLFQKNSSTGAALWIVIEIERPLVALVVIEIERPLVALIVIEIEHLLVALIVIEIEHLLVVRGVGVQRGETQLPLGFRERSG